MNLSETLQINLDKAATDLRTNGFAVFDDFLSFIEVHSILDTIDKKKVNGEFKKAGIGKESDFQIKKQVRGDLIRWIDEEEKIPTNDI
jgi:SM-20-related protein